MTTLTIGSTTIEITSCTKRRDVKRGFYLDLYIPQANIGMDELFSLLNNNEENIIITEADGTESVYVGFKQLGALSCEAGVYNVAQVCTSEYEAQLSLAQNKLVEQNKVIESMQSVIDTQSAALENHAKVIVDQTDAISAQTEIIQAQTAELELLNDTLLELLVG
jgi:hypothetical protein